MRPLLVPILVAVLTAPLSAVAQTDDYQTRLERVEDITRVLERGCLSGHEVSGDASLDAGISGLKRVLTEGLSGSLSAEAAARNARGAIGIIEDKVKLEENSAIRRCMEPYLERILDYLLVDEESGSEQACWNVAVKHPARFPYYLKNSVPLSNHFYWFYVDIENRCSSTLYASVTFKPDLPERDLPSIDYLKGAELMTLRPGERKHKTIDPRIRFLDRLDRPFPMKVDWSVNDDREALLGQGSVEIEVLPPDHFVWDLTDPDGRPIEKAFLLASLGAWSQNQPQAVRSVAEGVLDTVKIDFRAPLVDVARTWMAGAHDRLFIGDDRIRVFPTARRFPPSVRSRPIRAPGDVFARGRADPLEAALLLRSVSREFLNDLGIEQMLLMARDPADERNQSVYLLWSDPSEGQWKALNMAEAGWKAFDENLASATAEVERLIGTATFGRGLESLHSHARGSECVGAFFSADEDLYALDFARSRDCGIAGLPF